MTKKQIFENKIRRIVMEEMGMSTGQFKPQFYTEDDTNSETEVLYLEINDVERNDRFMVHLTKEQVKELIPILQQNLRKFS